MTSKFNCHKCEFATNYESLWNRHISTDFHKTGKKKIRSDKKCVDKCPQCEYKSNNNTNMTQHILNTHSTITERKLKFNHYCEICNYGTFSKSLYDKHTKSLKHINVTNYVNKNIANSL